MWSLCSISSCYYYYYYFEAFFCSNLSLNKLNTSTEQVIQKNFLNELHLRFNEKNCIHKILEQGNVQMKCSWILIKDSNILLCHLWDYVAFLYLIAQCTLTKIWVCLTVSVTLYPYPFKNYGNIFFYVRNAYKKSVKSCSYSRFWKFSLIFKNLRAG